MNPFALGAYYDDFDDAPKPKKRTRYPYKYHDVDRIALVTDSEGSDTEQNGSADRWRRSREESAILNRSRTTRLDDGAFDHLVRWCKGNIHRIEQQRQREREQNGAAVERLMLDKHDLQDDIQQLERQLREKKAKMSRINRQIVALTDAEPLMSPEGLSLEDKMLLFCKNMGDPKTQIQLDGYGRAHFYDYPFAKTHTQLVKIFHQIMSAMRVLHEDWVDKPSKADKKFKVYKPNRTKWQVLQDSNFYAAQGRDLYAEVFCSNEQDVRMACTALQNLLHTWRNHA